MLSRATTLALLAMLVIAAPVAAQSDSPRDNAEEALEVAQELADGRGARTGRELSVALAEVAAGRRYLSRSDQREADELLARPTDVADVSQPGGPYSTAARVWRNCSAHFCVHWVDSSSDAPPPTDANSCPTPDFVDHARRALEQSYAVENGPTQLAWLPPVPDGTNGGDAKTDVYLKELNTDPSAPSLYGYAATDAGQSGRSRSAFMVFDNDFAPDEFDYADYVVPLEVTSAHEYNHVLQYRYDTLQDEWMFESTATWAEEKVFPAGDDYHAYMDTWAGMPEEPLTSDRTSKVYGSAIWNHWLEQRYGADVIEEAWEQSDDSGSFAPKAYDLAIKAQPLGTSFEENFGDFAAATAAWEGADSGIHEAEKFTPLDSTEQLDVARGTSLVVPTTNRVVTLNHTGFALFDIDAPGTSALNLTMSLAPGEPVAAASIALVGLDDGEVTKVVGHADPTTGGATVTLPADADAYDRITAMVANADVSNVGFDNDVDVDDWIWTRDGQTMRISLDAPATPDPDVPVDEPLAPTATTPPADPPCGTTEVEREPIVATPTQTPSPTPTATPTVTPPPPPPATSVRLSRNTTRIGTAARKGVLSLFARTNKAGRLTARGTVDAATARRLKVGRRTMTAGTGRRTATAPARVKINVKLTRKVRAALKRQTRRTLRIRVRVTFVPVDGTRAVRRTLSVLLRP